jgi:pyruvate,water dikinase
MAEYLVEIGIDSMSLNPDAVLKTTLHVLAIEKKLGHKKRDEKKQKSQPRKRLKA